MCIEAFYRKASSESLCFNLLLTFWLCGIGKDDDWTKASLVLPHNDLSVVFIDAVDCELDVRVHVVCPVELIR